MVGLYLRPPGPCLGALRGRETADPSPGTHRLPALPMRPGSARAPRPRLQTAWHAGPLRGLGREGGHGRRGVPATPSPRRVPRLFGHHRRPGARRHGSPLGPRQRDHAQDQAHWRLAACPPALPPALYADFLLVAEPRWSAGSRRRAVAGSNAACSAARTNWKKPSASTSRRTTAGPSRSCGPRPPTRSSPASAGSANALPTQSGRREVTDSGPPSGPAGEGKNCPNHTHRPPAAPSRRQVERPPGGGGRVRKRASALSKLTYRACWQRRPSPMARAARQVAVQVCCIEAATGRAHPRRAQVAPLGETTPRHQPSEVAAVVADHDARLQAWGEGRAAAGGKAVGQIADNALQKQ